MAEKNITRKGSTPILVCVTPDEKQKIEALARQTGLSTSAYLRELGLGYVPKSIVDYQHMLELSKLGGDLGRLGGLLKLWLTDDVRTAQFGKETLLAALARIDDTQKEMVKVMSKVIRPHAERYK
ncbi:conjugal transfer transcriptional regulator TraJ [Methylocucumis oryzae]|uniref:Conjugal transfer protein TraJ n=1 Tax=Methylocucumis oryzae TaxID=1632867 RepID=A0A0F3IED8_9GAMM|nr:conjugal transfer transcriptional regulator TraJ [Methylocucumis oryzae]KJV05160.1 conjugal transfer protein TraJ [Methylocucumis oryzae]